MAKIACVLLCVFVILHTAWSQLACDTSVDHCVNLHNCRIIFDILKNIPTVEAVEMLKRKHCGFEDNQPMVCCPRKPSIGRRAKAASEEFLPTLPEPPTCGVSKTYFKRVAGENAGNLGDFPWMALLGYKTRAGTKWGCGGSLITSHHVLTAAHCIHNHEEDLYVVRLGELNLAREDEGASPVDMLIKRKIKHKRYSANTVTNDIGILVLEKDVQFTDLIRPICIPKDIELRGNSFDNYKPLIAGWGSNQLRGPSATHLQVLQLPVVGNVFCSQVYMQYKIDERVLCAGYKNEGREACRGDSGGPLMQSIYSSANCQTIFYQIGVTSFDKMCAEPRFPGIYSRITHFVPWIEKHVTGKSG